MVGGAAVVVAVAVAVGEGKTTERFAILSGELLFWYHSWLKKKFNNLRFIGVD